MKINRSSLLKLGIFIAAGLIIFFVAIYYLGKQQNIFSTGIRVYTEFQDVKGLKTGNNVRYLGTYAGYVSRISIKTDTVVRVEMMIDAPMGDFIRKNSSVEIQNDGVMGSKILVIHPGTADYGTITDNTRLPSLSSMSIEEVFGALEGTVDYTTRAAQNLWLVSDKVIEGKGFLGKLIYDTVFEQSINQLIQNSVEISERTNGILSKLDTVDNDIGKLLNQDDVHQRLMGTFNDIDTLLKNLTESSQEIKKATKALNQQQGIVNKALYDSSFAKEVDSTVTSLKVAIDDLVRTSEVIRRSWIFNLFQGRQQADEEQIAEQEPD